MPKKQSKRKTSRRERSFPRSNDRGYKSRTKYRSKSPHAEQIKKPKYYLNCQKGEWQNYMTNYLKKNPTKTVRDAAISFERNRSS